MPTFMQHGETFEADVTGEDEVMGPDGRMVKRYTIRKADGTLAYAMPVDLVGGNPVDTDDPLGHLQPPPGFTPEPPPGVDVVGSGPRSEPERYPVPGVDAPPPEWVAPPATEYTAQDVQQMRQPGRPVPPKPTRFMVKSSKGYKQTKVFHSRPDCGKVADDADRLDVDEAAIAFFELAQCSFCAKRDAQMSFPDALREVLSKHQIAISQEQALTLYAEVKAYGFSVSPQAVDR